MLNQAICKHCIEEHPEWIILDEDGEEEGQWGPHEASIWWEEHMVHCPAMMTYLDVRGVPPQACYYRLEQAVVSQKGEFANV
jgi:hypothetical protein